MVAGVLESSEGVCNIRLTSLKDVPAMIAEVELIAETELTAEPSTKAVDASTALALSEDPTGEKPASFSQIQLRYPLNEIDNPA